MFDSVLVSANRPIANKTAGHKDASADDKKTNHLTASGLAQNEGERGVSRCVSGVASSFKHAHCAQLVLRH